MFSDLLILLADVKSVVIQVPKCKNHWLTVGIGLELDLKE